MSVYSRLADSEEFARLNEVSSRLGRNPLQVQGAGGNTSLKKDGAMWIKASGTWLAEAAQRDIMVPVAVDDMRQAVLSNSALAADTSVFVNGTENHSGLKASIETSMHAVLEWPVVLHTHCVATIAATLHSDAQEYLASRLKDVRWQYIPYVKPGIDLARVVAEQANADTQVLILGNHGLVVCGETVYEAEQLLLRVSEQLEPDEVIRAYATDDLFARRLQSTGWCATGYPLTAAIAMDAARLRLAETKTFYPDHLVFLGPGALVAEFGSSPKQALAGAEGTKKECKLLFFRGEGAAIPEDAAPPVWAMARAVGDVFRRITPEKVCHSLTHEDELALLNWDAEKYRSGLKADNPVR